MRRLGLPARLRVSLADLRGDYGGAQLARLVLALVYVGGRRLEHLRYLAGAPLVLRFCGLRRPLTARTMSGWLKPFT